MPTSPDRVLTCRVDESVLLHKVTGLPADAIPLGHWLEQAVDTVLLRNTEVVCKHLLGQVGVPLFSNATFWGELDLACVQRDGGLPLFEVKKKRPSKADFMKFCRDVKKVSTWTWNGADLEDRWEHWKGPFAYYATRYFAGYFLDIRVETEKNERDIVGEACDVLGLTRQQFNELYAVGMAWHAALPERLADYLARVGVRREHESLFADLRPVLLVPPTEIERIEQLIRESELGPPMGVRCQLACYSFFTTDGGAFPTFMTLENRGTFTI